MLSELQKNMPQRTLKLSHSGSGGLITQISFGLFGLTVGIALAVYVFVVTQNILIDRKMIDNSALVPAAEIDGDSECVSELFIVTSCDVIIRHNGQTIERSFSFFDFNSDDHYSVEVIAQKDDPSNMTVDLAINKMVNRMMTISLLMLFALSFLLVSVRVFRAIPKNLRLKNFMNEPANQPWEFVAVSALVEYGQVIYTTEIDGNLEELTINIQGRNPIILCEQEDRFLVSKRNQKTPL